MDTILPVNCNQCHNQCPADQLKCGRGRAYFEALKNGEMPPERQNPSESDNSLVRMLSRCGRIAAHKSERMRAHGKDEAAMFSALTAEEQAQLEALLSRLDTAWQEEHGRHHERHHSREKQ